MAHILAEESGVSAMKARGAPGGGEVQPPNGAPYGGSWLHPMLTCPEIEDKVIFDDKGGGGVS